MAIQALNSEKIPIITVTVKHYFGFWNIQFLLLCLIDNYMYHLYKQSSQFITREANPAFMSRNSMCFWVKTFIKLRRAKNAVDSKTH